MQQPANLPNATIESRLASWEMFLAVELGHAIGPEVADALEWPAVDADDAQWGFGTLAALALNSGDAELAEYARDLLDLKADYHALIDARESAPLH